MDDFLTIKQSLLIIKGGGILPELPVQQRAGGLVFRNENNQIKFLLVTSNSNPNRWIIPAGHVEAGESYRETALREVAEEAGVEAAIFSALGVMEYVWYREFQKLLIKTHLYLMEHVNTFATNPEGRQVDFFSFEQTKALNMWAESREFIEKAYQLLKANN